MKLITLTSALVLLSASYALAGPGSEEPKQPADPSSGRPSAVLDDAKCASVWSMTQREGDTLSEGQAAPFIVSFQLVDANGDGKISEAEFKDGCKNGLVQEASAAEGAQQPSGKASPGDAAQPSGGAPASQQ
jgi:EF hand